ncbi:hypothetical protein J5I95_13755 [Candidatus Poribacteria bacterium]|nr:hypothetical protein [Candidatus Poribacteria bacterium]
MKREHDFIHNGNRYDFDWGECSASKGFAQVDTTQDASYFGIWTNPFDFITVSYTEGDIYRNTAESAEEYIAFLREMHSDYEKMGQPIIGIDPMLNDDLCQRFIALGLTDLLHESCRPKEASDEV